MDQKWLKYALIYSIIICVLGQELCLIKPLFATQMLIAVLATAIFGCSLYTSQTYIATSIFRRVSVFGWTVSSSLTMICILMTILY